MWLRVRFDMFCFSSWPASQPETSATRERWADLNQKQLDPEWSTQLPGCFPESRRRCGSRRMVPPLRPDGGQRQQIRLLQPAWAPVSWRPETLLHPAHPGQHQSHPHQWHRYNLCFHLSASNQSVFPAKCGDLHVCRRRWAMWVGGGIHRPGGPSFPLGGTVWQFGWGIRSAGSPEEVATGGTGLKLLNIIYGAEVSIVTQFS